MHIFVGYHFDPRDQWVKDLVYPIITAFGDKVVTGENLYGQGELGPAVSHKIKRSDALIGFATRREKVDDNHYTTHRWVTDEISQALALGLKTVEVREQDVDPQRGIAGGCQFIPYNKGQRDRCLVQLVEALGEWHRHNLVKLQLLPEECAQSIIPLMGDQQFRCVSQTYEDGAEEPNQETKLELRPLAGGLFAYIRDVPLGAFIRVSVQCGGRSWGSAFESTNHYGIRLREARAP
jgi:hypothetical protein